MLLHDAAAIVGRPYLRNVRQHAVHAGDRLVIGRRRVRRRQGRRRAGVATRSVACARLFARRQPQLGDVARVHPGHLEKLLKLDLVLNLNKSHTDAITARANLACGTLFQSSCVIPTSPTDCSGDS